MRKNVEENVIRRIRIRDGALILAMAETIIIKVDSITKLSVILYLREHFIKIIFKECVFS